MSNYYETISKQLELRLRSGSCASRLNEILGFIALGEKANESDSRYFLDAFAAALIEINREFKVIGNLRSRISILLPVLEVFVPHVFALYSNLHNSNMKVRTKYLELMTQLCAIYYDLQFRYCLKMPCSPMTEIAEHVHQNITRWLLKSWPHIADVLLSCTRICARVERNLPLNVFALPLIRCVCKKYRGRDGDCENYLRHLLLFRLWRRLDTVASLQDSWDLILRNLNQSIIMKEEMLHLPNIQPFLKGINTQEIPLVFFITNLNKTIDFDQIRTVYNIYCSYSSDQRQPAPKMTNGHLNRYLLLTNPIEVITLDEEEEDPAGRIITGPPESHLPSSSSLVPSNPAGNATAPGTPVAPTEPTATSLPPQNEASSQFFFQPPNPYQARPSLQPDRPLQVSHQICPGQVNLPHPTKNCVSEHMCLSIPTTVQIPEAPSSSCGRKSFNSQPAVSPTGTAPDSTTPYMSLASPVSDEPEEEVRPAKRRCEQPTQTSSEEQQRHQLPLSQFGITDTFWNGNNDRTEDDPVLQPTQNKGAKKQRGYSCYGEDEEDDDEEDDEELDELVGARRRSSCSPDWFQHTQYQWLLGTPYDAFPDQPPVLTPMLKSPTMELNPASSPPALQPSTDIISSTTTKRRRGRPRKKPVEDDMVSLVGSSADSASSTKRPVGRPRLVR